MGKTGVISSGDQHTSQAGAAILKAGGNTFDAICAAMLTAPLCEPMLTSLGGGGFMLAKGSNTKPILYDFFVDVPPSRTKERDFYPIEVDFGTTQQTFHIGHASIAIPGMVKGIYQIHKERGSMPLKEVIEPALKLAEEGLYLSKMQAYFVTLLEPILRSTKESEALFCNDKNHLIDHTHLFKNSEYAQFLESFATEGDRLFYEGEIAKSIEQICKENGGDLKREDFSNYKLIQREPIEFGFRGKTIITNPPPSAGGILIAFALKLLEKENLESFGSQTHLRKLIEAMVTSSDFRTQMIDEHLHRVGLEAILKDKSAMEPYFQAYRNRINLWGNTTHISVLDSQGNAASVTMTNGEGSGVIAPKSGIMLNNMLGEEDLNPHGFFSWQSGVRLPSMMAPTMVLQNSAIEMVLGSAGSNRIRSAIVQSIINFVEFGFPIQKCCDASRIHYERGELFIEPGFPGESIKSIQKSYPTTLFDDISVFFGGVNAVDNHFQGGCDPRRGGSVIVV